ncbi:MAG TPA: Hsp20/alpha crystallin family protein [Methanothrix sp.]|nr:Hsp20/alpha crystallin family protein [Methanothrix sp.]HPJ83148.1 Hsp20/alpha crystallin family protein [Methanothrix sp.]HPR65749.1 Hsp20/alpha crystallin family protein [Methanothrix sp.]
MREDAERMVGRAVMESMKRSVQAREVFKKMLGDVALDLPEAGDVPVVDVIDSPEEVVVYIDLPGTKKELIDLGVTEDAVTVKARFERPAGSYVLRERPEAEMGRRVKLSAEVKPEQVKAKYEDGVLVVRLPKLIVVKPTSITVE